MDPLDCVVIATFYKKLALDSFFSIQSQPKFVKWNLSRQRYQLRYGVQRYGNGKLGSVSRRMATPRTGVAASNGRSQHPDLAGVCSGQLGMSLQKRRLPVSSPRDVVAAALLNAPHTCKRPLPSFPDLIPETLEFLPGLSYWRMFRRANLSIIQS